MLHGPSVSEARVAITSKMIVADVMNKWPETVPVFISRRMACPGCVMAPFMSIAEAAREYGFKPDEFAEELSTVARRPLA